jgi:RNA-splicing ligase RtcB
MLEIQGKYNKALVMTDYPDEASLSQVYQLLNLPYSANSQIRYMADMHAGKGCTVGFTQTLNDYIIPNFVGVDIGCGIYAYNLGQIEVDFKKLDRFIKEEIPHGFDIHDTSVNVDEKSWGVNLYSKFLNLVDKLELELSKVNRSLGTLGGGNHFIELDKAPNGDIWLVVHSGSRNFGLQVCNYHQKKAKEFNSKALITGIPVGMEYLPIDMGGKEYLEDMEVAQKFAHLNREMMATIISEGFFNVDLPTERILSVHNYINFEDKIIRKGAIQANKDQRCVIPFNMRDGIAVCIGKGNRKWNNSAPHGAGRILSRSKAKEQIRLEDYQKTMEGIYTSCINRSTIDESPFAYKNYQQVISEMQETVDIEFIMKPIYNFKSA